MDVWSSPVWRGWNVVMSLLQVRERSVDRAPLDTQTMGTNVQVCNYLCYPEVNDIHGCLYTACGFRPG